MIYTDKIHLVADTLTELHDFAKSIGLKRCYYHGVKKGHPHYDLMTISIQEKAINAGAIIVSSKEILITSKKLRIEKENTRKNCPFNSFKYGQPSGKCWSDGHYKCSYCQHLNPIFLDKEKLDMAYRSQNGIIIRTLI